MTDLYSIYDEKSLSYGPPFEAAADQAAGRIFLIMLLDDESQVGRFPADYVLYRVGTWDDRAGLLEGHTPVFLARGNELVSSHVARVRDQQSQAEEQQHG